MKQCSILFRTFQVELGLTIFLNGFNNPRNGLVEMLHSATPRNVKEYVTSQFSAATNHLRVLIATIAYGMGMNCQGVTRVIHFGPPRSEQRGMFKTRNGETAKWQYISVFRGEKELYVSNVLNLQRLSFKIRSKPARKHSTRSQLRTLHRKFNRNHRKSSYGELL